MCYRINKILGLLSYYIISFVPETSEQLEAINQLICVQLLRQDKFKYFQTDEKWLLLSVYNLPLFSFIHGMSVFDLKLHIMSIAVIPYIIFLACCL